MTDTPYEIDIKKMRKKFKHLKKPETLQVVNEDTGEVTVGINMVGHHVFADTTDFVKLYEPKILLSLSKSAIAVLCYIMDTLRYDSYVKFDYYWCTRYTGYKNRKSLYDGLQELLKMDIIRHKQGMEYFVNPNIFFKGDRGKLVK